MSKKPRNETYFEDQLNLERKKTRELRQTITFMKKIHKQKRESLEHTILELKNEIVHLKKKKK